MDFFGFIGVILICLVALKFLSYLFRVRTQRYNDWVRQERRRQLLELVREVRMEKGDYNRARTVPRVKRKQARARPAARRRN